jgi:chromosome partitioning protein
MSMANFDTKLTLDTTFNAQTALKEFLDLVDADKNYDLIFIDSPPSLSKVTTMAHYFSDLILMPIEAEKFSLDGLEFIFHHLERIKKNHESSVRIFINKFDNKPRIDFAIAAEVSKNYGDYLCETVIPFTSGLKTSIAEGEVVWSSQKKHNALAAFDNLLREILDLNSVWGKANQKLQSKPSEPTIQL